MHFPLRLFSFSENPHSGWSPTEKQHRVCFMWNVTGIIARQVENESRPLCGPGSLNKRSTRHIPVPQTEDLLVKSAGNSIPQRRVEALSSIKT